MAREQLSHREATEAKAAAEATMRLQSVPVNMYETSGAVVIVAPLPAVTADDVTVELRDRRVRFWAHLRSAAPRQYLLNEWDYGGYEREVEVPAGYGSGLEASLANGQIAIRVLKGAPGGAIEAKPNEGAPTYA
jgi:HSP20 family molecular chaperone IbpA